MYHKKSGQCLNKVLTVVGLLTILSIVVIAAYVKHLRLGMAALTRGISGGDAEVASLNHKVSYSALMDAIPGDYRSYTGNEAAYMAVVPGYASFLAKSTACNSVDESHTVQSVASSDSGTATYNQAAHSDSFVADAANKST